MLRKIAKVFDVSDSVRNNRLSECKKCDRLTLGICRECGCPVKSKVRFSDMSCPLGKWDKEV